MFKDLYPFSIDDILILELSEGAEASCVDCGWLERFGRQAQAGVMATELLSHSLHCRGGEVPGFKFKLVTWEPSREEWLDYELRMTVAFYEALMSHRERSSVVAA